MPRGLRRARRALLFWGRAHRCPVCAASLRALLPEGCDFPVLRQLDVVGGERWEASSCPVCFATTRTRLVWYWLSRESGLLDAPLRVLHVAPDFGIHWQLLARKGLGYRAVDLDPTRYGYAGSIDAGDLTALEEEDGSVDLLIANHVLEHVEDEARALAEVRRVLRPGGTALLQVPIALKLDHTLEDPAVDTPEARERRYGQADHVRLYGRDYPARLERSGFRVELYAAPAEVCESWRLNPRERLPILSPR